MEFAFGKWKGYKMSDPEVPTAYLEWVYETNVKTAEAAHAELMRREQVEAENMSMAERIIRSGFHTMQQEYVGEPDELRELEGARAALEELLEKYLDSLSNVQPIKPAEKRRRG